MRVIAGVARGRSLRAPVGGKVRPTSDRVREAVFNALWSMDAIEGARVLDLFAGTGALGIEALSRGAAHAVFVEPDREAVQVLRANLDAVDLAHLARVERTSAERFLGAPSGEYDLALLDPPYSFEGWSGILDRLPARLVVIESRVPVEVGPDWVVVRERRYGGTLVAIARRGPDPTIAGVNEP